MLERKIINQSKSFKDLDKTLKKLIKNKKAKLAGSIFEYLTKLYLEVSPEYKTKLSKVYLLNEVPTSLKKKLRLPNTDEGIDLIAETFDNEYWAIQCKYRSDNTETLKVKGDLATFNNLAFTVCKNISHGIVAATVNRPPKKTKLLSVGYILLTEWLNLDRDNGDLFNQIKLKAAGKVSRPKLLSPRPHQKAAIAKTISYFKSKERGKMIMPCGTGKSLTAFWIAVKMRPKSILVAVPSLALLQQTLKVWTREFLLHNIQPDWLCVCSDDTVKEEQDDFVTFSADLGIKVDTDPRVIRNFLRKKTKKLKIVFTTYQSGRATAIGSKGFIYDLGIMDEAHKTVGSGSKPMAHLLHQKNIKIKKRLFMTATERLFRGDSDEYMSMDDPRDYGDLIYELSFKEAINSKPPIISDYKIITFGITTPEIEKITEDNKYLEVKKDLKDITARELATAIALRKAIKKLKIKNAISFHRSIRRADNFRKQQDLISKVYPTYGKLKTFHVKGDMPTSDRALEMLSFEEEKGLMTNARCLTEGVDLPAIDCVCFTDPKRSKVDIVQAAGRALRLSKGKKFGYILIPIFIPDGMTFDEAAEEQGFDDVSITVRALATTDKRIVEYLRAVSEGKKPRGGSPVDGITSINELYKVEAEKFNKAVQLKVWDKVAVSNYRSYEEAKKIAIKNDIKNQREWHDFCLSTKKPRDIPYKPESIYKNKGWINWGEFFGTKYIANQLRKYFEFDEAKKYIKELNIKSNLDWKKYCKSKKYNPKLPKAPDIVYKSEWCGWPDFLSKNKFLSYEEAKKYIKDLGFINFKEYSNYIIKKNIDFLPKYPRHHYKKDFSTMIDFLTSQTEKSGKKLSFMSYEETKKFARSLKLKSGWEWRNLKKNKNIKLPKGLSLRIFQDEIFEGWKEFLGTSYVGNDSEMVKFCEAKDVVRKLKVKTITQYLEVKKEIREKYKIPLNPAITYKKEWKGWPDFLGKK
ncbi:DEAD/DEAH box helicase family protein [Candidatus Pelagibacter sp.]|nr:DEAD/DEAH box helicase family protein [Candidatus Pelagibacter sp.]